MMNIVYASDNNFAEIMGVSITSLLEHNKSSEKIQIHILEDNISEENKKNLLELSGKYNCQIIFYDVKKYLQNDMKQKRGSLSTFSRLFITKILPESIAKVLYIDCDTLIIGSLEKMYSTDITGFYAAGVKDPVSIHHYQSIGLDRQDCYVNAGVMLINIEKWREDNLPEKFMRFLDRYNGNVPYADQGTLNGVMAGKIKILPPEYNCHTLVFDLTYKNLMRVRQPYNYYTIQQFEAARKNPVIIHFTTNFTSLRPWIEGSTHPYKEEWLKYKSASPWSGLPLRQDNRSALKKLFVGIYNILPDCISAKAVGLLHARIMPMLNGRKK